ncbi:LysE family transporter [Streptomyces hundungensis]|uniref:LysE family transporter n=1 Tax=Streptomyces hundungensis TaxID=1077946 RepID=UPI0033E5CB03
MSELWTTALAGAAAGLGVAVPVGAVGVLLVQEGMRERRGAMAAAAAVATVDLAYAALATALGPLIADALSGVEAWVRLASALVLATIAGHGLWASRRRPAREAAAAPVAPEPPTREAHTAPTDPAGPPQDAAHAGPGVPARPTRQAAHAAPTNPAAPPQEAPHAAPGAPASPPQDAAHPAPTDPARPTRQAAHAAPPKPAGPARTFARFTALTLINPTTALYFAALTTARGSSLRGGAAGAVFVAGVFAASLLWQQFLVAASGFAGARISPAARAWTFRAGYGLVALYAVKVALPLP